MPDHHVENIASALAGLPLAEKHRLLVDAFNHALAKRPYLTNYELDPRVVQLVGDIYQRTHEIEQDKARCSH